MAKKKLADNLDRAACLAIAEQIGGLIDEFATHYNRMVEDEELLTTTMTLVYAFRNSNEHQFRVVGEKFAAYGTTSALIDMMRERLHEGVLQ